ncbi:hypothetical protein QP400_08400 [Winkia sp. UMB3158]|uniref:Uncharacterized protein n=2 Tax=Winkia neuii TaxID=33007 RepID=K0Z3Y2_9ACTO|nr:MULTISPECIES: hypothetical protein [Winkia]MDK8341770.1 hypothetical protein [Winkia sp. UMB3164B]OFT38790.1 hypothetical protein HMPREF3163_05215 [Actinomyces sp. HMSC08A01]PLB80265.1 hypothetical protein CYJ21_06250 [Actinomyces sp. UMB0138]PMC94277.1 hypothetical protein CJ188_03390 [Actinomyces sp. UMB0918]EJZ86869.1 hypothetical protein HMPREF9240_01243 [Winkia neuii BV029A5]
MADLKVNQNDLEELKSNFDNIRNTLSLQSDGSISPSIENVGHRKVVTALRGFNRQVQSTRNKYQKKVERFSGFIDQVIESTDHADSDMAQTIQEATPTISTSAGGYSSF